MPGVADEAPTLARSSAAGTVLAPWGPACNPPFDLIDQLLVAPLCKHDVGMKIVAEYRGRSVFRDISQPA
jgi:hypothetical protein